MEKNVTPTERDFLDSWLSRPDINKITIDGKNVSYKNLYGMDKRFAPPLLGLARVLADLSICPGCLDTMYFLGHL